MYEKVNPSHPDKVADRIAGAMVDAAYAAQDNPKVAVEVLIGHGKCFVIAESSYAFGHDEVSKIVERISGIKDVELVSVPQDPMLSGNQELSVRCGDNGIFCGCPVSKEQSKLAAIAKDIYSRIPHDGKYIIDGETLVICQSNACADEIGYDGIINPLGMWTGGTDADSGATNRKLGSDMGDAVTGGGLHGKDLSKADVSVNIYAHIKAQEIGERINMRCAIGDEYVNGIPYSEIVETAREYIESVGGFERFAEWGLIR